QHVVRDHRDAEGEQRGLGIAQRVDLAVERRLQLLEGGFQRPTFPIQIGYLNGTGFLLGQIGQDVDGTVAVPGRLVQLHGDPPREEDLPLVVGQADFLLEDVPRLATPFGYPLADGLPIQRRSMLAGHERPAPVLNPKRNAVVQKLRSLIHKSPGWTISRMASVIDRSWACPSSQRTTSVISIRWGSSTTKAWPGKAPARVNRRGLRRCSVPGKWLPSRI